jgi:hypothetical protein
MQFVRVITGRAANLVTTLHITNNEDYGHLQVYHLCIISKN